MSTKGIIRAKVDQSSVPADQYEHFIMTGIIELYDRNSEFVVRVDPDDAESIGRNTTNPKITADRTNWIFIREHVWDTIMQQEDGLNNQSKFQNLQTLDLIAATATGTASVKVGSSGLGKNMFLEGIVFLAIPYSNYPEKSAAIKFVYLEEQPKFIYALFEPSNLGDKLNARVSQNQEKEKLYVYGQSAKLKIYTHRFNTAQGNAANTTVKIKGEVLADGGGKIDDFELEEKHLGASIGSYNHQFEYSLALKPEWRSLSNHTKGETKLFIVRLKAEIFIENPVKPRINSITKGFASMLLPDLILTTPSPEIQTDKNEIFSWSELDGETGNFERLYMQSYIQVRWDHLSVILEQFEIEKQNMITYIGDIPYSKKEYNPCGFAQIRIADLSEPSREIVTIFDEDRESASMDNTPASFEIVAGEKRQDVLIKLEGLQTEDCQSLLLPQGEFHTEQENIFLMEKAFYSGQVNPFGTYVVEDNASQVGDLDVVADPNRRHDNVAGKQGLIVSEDYEIKSKEELLLKLKYVFNKGVQIGEREFNPNIFDEMAGKEVNSLDHLGKDLWLLNYLWMTSVKPQLYFVPVATCRYPNQLIRVHVYPDIKWTLLLKFNFKEEDFEAYKTEYKYDVTAYSFSETTISKSTISSRSQGGVRVRKKATRSAKENKGTLKRLYEILKRMEVSLTAEWKDANGSKQELDVVEAYLKPFYDLIMKVKGIIDLISAFAGIEDNTDENGNFIGNGTNQQDRDRSIELDDEYNNLKKRYEKDQKTVESEMKKVMGKQTLDGYMEILFRRPQKIEMLYPSIALAASWWYQTVEDPNRPELAGRKGLQIKTKLEAKPLLGISLTMDILEMVARRHPLAWIIKKALDLSLYQMSAKNRIKVAFSLSGQYDLAAAFEHNLLAGNIGNTGYSTTGEQNLIQGDTVMKGEFKGELAVNLERYVIIAELSAGGTFEISARYTIALGRYLAADAEGVYIASKIHSEGLTFYIKVEGKMKFVFLGLVLFDWNPKYEPKPFTVGKFEQDFGKIYFNNQS